MELTLTVLSYSQLTNSRTDLTKCRSEGWARSEEEEGASAVELSKARSDEASGGPRNCRTVVCRLSNTPTVVCRSMVMELKRIEEEEGRKSRRGSEQATVELEDSKFRVCFWVFLFLPPPARFFSIFFYFFFKPHLIFSDWGVHCPPLPLAGSAPGYIKEVVINMYKVPRGRESLGFRGLN